jgi:omega-6 fatty acid desaturase (delta-12 desaturase)
MMFVQRIPGRYRSSGTPKTASVWTTNITIAVAITVLAFLIGLQSVLWVYLPAAYLSASAGVYLFYVQHQFDQAYWERHSRWDYATAAVAGSSYFKLPKVLQWFTGNIGLHHVHHLAPRVPNYNLQRAHDENALFQAAPVITLASSVKCLRLALWDEQQKKMVPFSAISSMKRA